MVKLWAGVSAEAGKQRFLSTIEPQMTWKLYFSLSEIIFHEKMVSLSNNDRFDNDKIFLRNIWHFSVITRINYVSIFLVFILKINERTLL